MCLEACYGIPNSSRAEKVSAQGPPLEKCPRTPRTGFTQLLVSKGIIKNITWRPFQILFIFYEEFFCFTKNNPRNDLYWCLKHFCEIGTESRDLSKIPHVGQLHSDSLSPGFFLLPYTAFIFPIFEDHIVWSVIPFWTLMFLFNNFRATFEKDTGIVSTTARSHPHSRSRPWLI